jgi:hypothetical protein
VLGTRLELALVGKNLTDAHHLEFAGDSAAGNLRSAAPPRAAHVAAVTGRHTPIAAPDAS